MFTTILFYFIVIMLIAGIVINFILWMVELKDAYKHSVAHKQMMSKLSKGRCQVKSKLVHLKPTKEHATCPTIKYASLESKLAKVG